MRDNQSESDVSAIALEMQRLVRSAAMPVQAGETVKGQQRRAWDALKRPPFWRLRAAWYGEAGCWSAASVEDMRRRDKERREKEARANGQAKELGALYATIAQRLASSDADFHSHDVAALLDAARALGALDSTVDRE